MISRADFSKEEIVKITSKQTKELLQRARRLPIGERYRLCLHDSPENELQEMLICRSADDYFWVERHDFPETHIIVEGKELMVFFDECGGVRNACLLAREEAYICRTNGGIWHMTIPLTEVAIDYEVAPGPFDQTKHIHPDWAPNGDDEEEARAYVEEIKEKAMRYLHQ